LPERLVTPGDEESGATAMCKRLRLTKPYWPAIRWTKDYPDSVIIGSETSSLFAQREVADSCWAWRLRQRRVAVSDSAQTLQRWIDSLWLPGHGARFAGRAGPFASFVPRRSALRAKPDRWAPGRAKPGGSPGAFSPSRG